MNGVVIVVVEESLCLRRRGGLSCCNVPNQHSFIFYLEISSYY